MPLPTGTLTFLFTDIEGSTRLWESNPEAMQAALALHDSGMRDAIESHNGSVFKTIGDAFCAAFPTAADAVQAALDAQFAVNAQEPPLRVRMAIHSGTAEVRDNDYFGPTLNRVARILSSGHGGQVLLSEATHELVKDKSLGQASFKSLGQHRLKDIARPETLYQLSHPSLRAEFPILNTLNLAECPNNIPSNMTSFVGREKELADTTGLLGKTRLLTLHGTGGCGKTRLALKLATSQMERFTEGVWYIELAAIRDSALVPQSVATILGLKEDPGRDMTSALTKHLASRNVLLILDNAEHVLASCASLAATILRACPNVTILVTTREPLAISGEQTYRVPSLEVPNMKHLPPLEQLAQLGSIQLFIERARLVRPDFEINQANAVILAQLCARLDGIPLAIELAAVRVRSLTIEEIATRLDNRFRLLTGGDRAALPRQQTLKALVDWSYELLSAQEMVLFQRLSVFSGGWTLEAAEQITPDAEFEAWEVLDLLTSLADKSLVVTLEESGELRYRMLETMRQYASERRAESGGLGEFQRRHLDYFFQLAKDANAQLAGPHQSEVLEKLEVEHDNIRLALEFCLRDPSDATVGLELAGALNRFWRVRGYLREARAVLDSLLEIPHSPEPNRARAEALFGAGLIAWMQGDYDGAVVYQNQSFTQHRAIGDKRGEANSLGNLAFIAHSRAEYAAAQQLFQESLNLRREIGEKQGIANSLGGLGMVAFLQKEFDHAKALHAESLAIRRELGDKEGVAVALMNLGSVACELNECPSGRAHLGECLTLIRELGNRRSGAFALEALASIEDRDGNSEVATKLHGAAQRMREEIGSPQPSNELEEYHRTLAALENRLGEAHYEKALHDGRQLDFEHAITFALGASDH